MAEGFWGPDCKHGNGGLFLSFRARNLEMAGLLGFLAG
jgi:hypothetical protein